MKKTVASFLLLFFFQTISLAVSSSSNAFTIGCKKVQSEAEMLTSRAKIGMDLEKKYLNMRLYFDAYQLYFKANEDFRDWERLVSKSNKCFRSAEISRIRILLKPISSYQTMSSRYGQEVARKNNYGSPDPCFKYLGEDNAYLKCRISVG